MQGEQFELTEVEARELHKAVSEMLGYVARLKKNCERARKTGGALYREVSKAQDGLQGLNVILHYEVMAWVQNRKDSGRFDTRR